MIVAFNCPVCKHDGVPLDHYEVSECGLTIHPDYATMVLHSNDEYYGKGLTTVTAGLGCPRSRAIEYDAPVAVNPLDYNALLIGSAWDVAIQKHAPADCVKIRLQGEIAGIPMQGEIDRVRRLGDQLIIEDHKHANQFQLKWMKIELEKARKEGTPPVKAEYRIQIRMYAELYAQQFGERPTRGILWNHFSGPSSNSSPALFPIAFDLADLTIEQCLAHKPYGGDFTVEELYRQAEGYHAANLADGDDAANPFSLPLAGASMSFGTKEFCAYCQVQKECMKADRGAAF